MVGPASLRSQKALLTRYCNNLHDLIKKCTELETEEASFQDVEVARRAQILAIELNATSKLVEEALSKFTITLDSMDADLSEEEDAQATEYMGKAHDALNLAHTTAIQLEARRISAREYTQRDSRANGHALQEGQIEANMPRLPIFTGKVWEFNNFWTLFEANVHNQPLTRLQKFNYLISALRGEARDTLRRFTVTESNYDHAVEFLRTKYGDQSRLIDSLQTRLERARAEGQSLEGQRRLLEQIMPIVTQLEERGVSLDGSFLSQKILSKFKPELQRKMLEHRMAPSMQERTWVMSEILQNLDNAISTEERINNLVNKGTDFHKYPKKSTNNFESRESVRESSVLPCIFCNASSHRGVACTKYSTIEERSKFFRETNRCLKCGIAGHFIKECVKDGCKACNGNKHHHTLCPLRNGRSRVAPTSALPSKVGNSSATSRVPVSRQQRGFSKRGERTLQARHTQAHAQVLQSDLSTSSPKDTISGDVVQESRTVLSTIEDNVFSEEHKEKLASDGKVFLLTGVAKIFCAADEEWKSVEILMDTGADQSFISDELAHKLGLACKSQRKLVVYTFGATKPKNITCGVTSLSHWDQNGNKHDLRLHTTPTITAASPTVHLSNEDLAFIATHKIRLSKADHSIGSKPQILLGCDQLWNLLDVPYPRFRLPSGLQLIPSKLGYLLTGRCEDVPQQEYDKEAPVSEIKPRSVNTLVNSDEELDKWDTYWSKGSGGAQQPETNPIFTHTLTNFDEKMERWDKYWTLDSTGICEFNGTKNAEREATNKKVAEFFEETIEKRDDGYYVRFPFKENCPPLPSNRAIAMKRLLLVYQALQKSPQLLQEYHNTVVQQELGVIEQITGSSQTGMRVHYIPHQPVLTPQKDTTNLRVVFEPLRILRTVSH